MARETPEALAQVASLGSNPSLVIKATRLGEALQAAHDHGIQLLDIVDIWQVRESDSYTVLLDVDTLDISVAAKWYCEAPTTAPYPISTLLWYRTN